MTRIYYGIWRGMYSLAWPIRFLIEAAVVLPFVWLFCLGVKAICTCPRVKEKLVKLVVWVVIEFDGLFGRNTAWGAENDEKISSWGRKKLAETPGKKRAAGRIFTRCAVTAVIVIYILAILPDLPFSHAIHSYYMEPLSGVKVFFQKIEAYWSKGYEQVPDPIIPVSTAQKPKKGKNTKKQKKISIRLTGVGKKGAPLRKKPSAKAKIAGRAKVNQKLVYKAKYKKDGKRYWFKVYLPSKKVNGWISSQYVKKGQIKEIVN